MNYVPSEVEQQFLENTFKERQVFTSMQLSFNLIDPERSPKSAGTSYQLKFLLSIVELTRHEPEGLHRQNSIHKLESGRRASYTTLL